MASRQVSVDFGGSSLKGIEFSLDKKGGLTVHSTAEIALAVGTIQGGLVESPVELAVALKELWAAGKFKSKQVVFGVSNKYVIVRRVDVDWMDPKVFGRSLRYQIPDGILAEDEQYLVDYHLLAEFQEQLQDGTYKRRSRILLVAAAQDMIDTYVEAINEAGFRPGKADLLAFAQTRVAARRGDTGVELLVDIGAHTINLVIHREGQPLFVRGIPGRGGEYITQELVRRFEWTHEVAEKAKHDLGVSTALAFAHTPSAFGGADQQANPEPHPAQAVIDKHASEFVTEIRNSVDYFLQSAAGTVQSVNGVIFSGGGALMAGMAERIASELQIPVIVAQPFKAVGAKTPIDENDAPRWNSVVGVATGAKR